MNRHENLFPGFSGRLNALIELAGIDAPQLDKGRASWFADLTGTSKVQVAHWLKHDRPPKPVMIRQIVKYLSSHMPSFTEASPEELECWLFYGDLWKT
ncbi:hypothetical protein [Teredinibacter turnerae]|uniref:hypothetical protein n=1 Tax=Teredinibacter turnerae TaxID=2426 RepID=UPI00036D4763|nr:hypothetical protein [Teredinibacter turnerae]